MLEEWIRQIKLPKAYHKGPLPDSIPSGDSASSSIKIFPQWLDMGPGNLIFNVLVE